MSRVDARDKRCQHRQKKNVGQLSVCPPKAWALPPKKPETSARPAGGSDPSYSTFALRGSGTDVCFGSWLCENPFPGCSDARLIQARCRLRRKSRHCCEFDSFVARGRLLAAFSHSLGQKRTFRSASAMSALPPKADIGQRLLRQSWRCKFDPWMLRIALNQQ